MTSQRWLSSSLPAGTIQYLSLLALSLWVGCGDSRVPSPGTSIRIDPDGRVVVSNALGRPDASYDTLKLTEVQRMGALDSGPQAFGDVVGQSFPIRR